jgi:hypothetical protein
MKKFIVEQETKIPDTDIILEKGDRVAVLKEMGDFDADDATGEITGNDALRQLVKFGKCYAFRVSDGWENVNCIVKIPCKVKKLGRYIKAFNLSKGINLDVTFISDVKLSNGIVTIETKKYQTIEFAVDEDVANSF